METIFNFLEKIISLQTKERSPYKWLNIKEPETIAQHSFRVILMSWILAKGVFSLKTTKRITEMALFHDLHQAETGDTTPYWGLSLKKGEEMGRLLEKWLRLPKKQKEKKEKKRLKLEEKAVKKIIKDLPAREKRRILSLWLTYKNFHLAEGKFVRETEEIETLLQAISYWQNNQKFPINSWWEEAADLVDIPKLAELLVEIDNFYNREKEISKTLQLLISLSKLKNKSLNIGKCQNKISPADYSFVLAVIVWLFSGCGNNNLNKDRLIKIAILEKFDFIFADKAEWESEGSLTKQGFLDEKKKKNKKMMERKLKNKSKIQDFILPYWKEYWQEITPEASFVRQAAYLLDVLELYFLCRQNNGGYKELLNRLLLAKEIVSDKKMSEFLSWLDKRISNGQ